MIINRMYLFFIKICAIRNNASLLRMLRYVGDSLALGLAGCRLLATGANDPDTQTEHTMTNLHAALTDRFADAAEIQDVANHGCQGGVNGFIWNHEVCEFFDQYEEEIYDYLNDCEMSMINFVDRNGGSTITTLKVNMVWATVELWCQAQNMVNEMALVAS